MRRTVLTVVLSILAILILEAVAGVAYLYSGGYNISTLNHDNGPINWALDKGMTRSVVHHARGIQVPDLKNLAMADAGFEHYDQMCVSCHGAPGVDPEDIAMGVWPDAPDLAKTVPDWTPAQLFWIVKNGIKFTSMPAWGPTHSDDKIWAMVAFLEQLPHLSSADYQKLQQKLTRPGQTSETAVPHRREHEEAGR